MALTPGTRLGNFEILAPIGAGGMGEVYKAKDTRLDRTVAIKVLPEHLAQSPERKARFEREAKAISQLNHPHICTLYDVGEQDGIDFIVMEYIEGETLAERLTKGRLKLDQALEYGVQIADGLDKAHRAGIVHRDLKPGNVMLTKAGVKLLDFGLARLIERDDSLEISDAPTRQKGLTAEEAIIGTLQYMAPEQLDGKAADSRTDIFAFGAVLYEMVTGKRAFEGKSQASLIASIMTSEPPAASTLQSMSPATLDHVVQRCLAKVPDDRWQSASDVVHLLKWSVEGDLGTEVVARSPRHEWLRPVVGLLVGGVVAGMAAWNFRGASDAIRPPATRMTIPVPDGFQMWQQQNPVLKMSPDGRSLAYASDGRLHLRRLDRFDGVPLIGTEGVDSLTFSPDGEWIAFTVFGVTGLKKIAVEGGPVLTVAEEATGDNGVDWGTNGEIVYVPALGSSGLRLMSADGRGTRQITSVLDSELENSHLWPQLLPDGKSVLFTVIGPSGGWEDARIVVQDIASGERRATIQNGTYGRFVSTGHILYAQADGTILAVPFDLARLRVTGPAFTVASGVRVAGWGGGACFTVTDGGTLAFVLGSSEKDELLIWVDRDGNSVRQLGASLAGGFASVSPDGSQVALTIRQPNHNDIWLVDTVNGERQRLTFESTEDESPIWSPNGERIAYSSAWTGQARRVYVKPVDGSSEPELLYTGEFHFHLTSWSPDGKWLALMQFHPDSGTDVGFISADGKGEWVPVAATAATEAGAVFSPDGRWLAYHSDETGREEVYVVSFPSLGAKRQVSRNGGAWPQWNPQGDELFYRAGDDIMTVAVRGDGPALRSEAPKLLFSDANTSDPVFDVAPDGRHFAMLVVNEAALGREIHVVLNWFSELERLNPAN